jgi:hypothetical protein
MGKEAREARRAHERLAGQHPAAFAAAAMADELFARRWRGAEDDYSLVLGQVRRRQTSARLHVEEIHGYVSQLRSSGYDWPAATYLPVSPLGAELGRSLYRDTGQAVPRDDLARQPVEQFAMYWRLRWRRSLAGIEPRCWRCSMTTWRPPSWRRR